MAGNTNNCFRLMSSFTFAQQVLLDFLAIPGILVTHDKKTRVRCLPEFHSPFQLLFQILLSFENHKSRDYMIRQDLRTLEKKLGPTIRLVAVETRDVLYALEAKMGPNQWQRVDEVYPVIRDIKAYYAEEDAAREAKGWLKGFLINNTLHPKPKKRPIRIRQVVNTESGK
jgi:hypothetical protein